ncbi:MAG TPA: serine/threonine-protein kinase, partial [Rugosimonospora sp.]|nr:serine/threonine-protein kinase [Rugosimonospora sp.]
MQLLGSRYRLAEPLGTGGMSVVWRGYDELLGRLVAVKVLAKRTADAESFSGRIRQEAMASARITHPNIAGVYDYGEATDAEGARVPYMVMELVEGRSLAHRLNDGPLPWRQAIRVCAEVAAGLVAAHEMGLVHRDISPANVLLAPTGAKIIDFGISAPVGTVEAKSMRLGTPAFISPERFANGGRVHPAADVYGLGVLLYQSLSGALPWPADSISQLLSQQRYVAPQPLPPVPDL